MAKGGKKTRFSKVRAMIAKNFNPRQVKKLVRSVVKDVFGESEQEQMTRVRGIAKRSGGGAGKFFGPPVQKRSWSALTKNLGAKILRMGPNVPPELQAAAQDAVDGVGDYRSERELQEVLRGGMNIQKSGAKWLNRQVANVRRGVQTFAQVGVMFDQAQHGGLTGGAARGALTDMALGKASDLVKSKMAEKIAISLANAMGANPAKFTGTLLAIGRGLRMGGAVGAIVQAGFAAGEEYYGQRKRSASAQIATHNAARAAGIDAKYARDVRRGVGVVKEEGVMGVIKGALGFNADAEEERARRTSEAYRLTAEARGVAGRLGVDVSGVLDRLAKSKGIAVEDLSPEEINRELDPMITSAAKKTISADQIKAKLITDKVVAGNTTDTVGQVTTDVTGATAAAALTGPLAPFTGPMIYNFLRARRADSEEAAAKAAEVDLANRRVADLKNQPQKEAAAQRRRQSDVPPKFNVIVDVDGMETKIPNPEYDRYISERRKTNEQVRTYSMEQKSYVRRKQVVWAD